VISGRGRLRNWWRGDGTRLTPCRAVLVLLSYRACLLGDEVMGVAAAM
jgi:hypothetical protein